MSESSTAKTNSDSEHSNSNASGSRRLTPRAYRNRNFAGASFRGADLRGSQFIDCLFPGTNFQGANLQGTIFYRCDLSNAKLESCDARLAVFSGECRMTGANMRLANLQQAQFRGTDLSDARLDSANLRQVLFLSVNFRGTHLTDAELSETLFCDCSRISESRGLHRTRHFGPSHIDMQSLRKNIAALPDEFLWGVGLIPGEVERLRSLYAHHSTVVAQPTYVFHAPSDRVFAEELRAVIRKKGFPSWICPQDMAQLEPAEFQFQRNIAPGNAIIIVLSEEALSAPRIAQWMIAAIELELSEHRQHLFPVTVDHTIMDPECLKLAGEMVASSAWSIDWVRYIRAYPLPDFRRRRNPKAFELELARLTRLLANPPGR